MVDATDLRGALCARILADLGADVVRVTDTGSSFADRHRNAGKRHSDRTLAELLRDADILVENVGLDTSGHPHVVHVSLADFGLSGRRSSWRLEPLPAQAAGGTLFASGFPDRPPCWFPGFLGHDCASFYGAVGAIAAIMDRRRHGRGQRVEVSVQEATLAGTNPWSVAICDYLKINPQLPAAGGRNADGSYWVLPASDGWVRTVIGNDKQWKGFVRLLRDPPELLQPEWSKPVHRLMNGSVVREVAARQLADRTRAELFEEARQVGATLGVIHMPSEYIDHPQTKARDVFTRDDDGVPAVRCPLRITPSPAAPPAPVPPVTVPPAPVPTMTVPPVTLPPTPADDVLLAGLKVVEFGMAAVGPEASLVLSELGADIVKVESLSHLDVLRSGGLGRINCSFAFNTECRGRRSVALNLDTERGRQLAFALCAEADVVIENYRGGVLDDAGLGYEQVKGANPSVIYASSQGYGRSGPLARMPAYGPLNLGFAGLHHLWNHPDAPYPCGTSLNHPDHIAGKLLAAGILAALDRRNRSGDGSFIEMAQTDVAAYLSGEVYMQAWKDGVDPPAMGNAISTACPHGVFPSLGDNAWIAIAVAGDEEWIALCSALGWEQSPELATVEGRLANASRLEERLASWTRTRDAVEAAAHLQEHGVSASPVMGPLDHLADPHLLERGFIVELEHPEVGSERQAGNPLRMSLTPQRVAASAPCLGADTVQVLGEVLGLSEEDVAQLVEAGVCT